MRRRIFVILLVFAVLAMPGYAAYAESGGVEYAFDLFTIVLPETYRVITRNNYLDKSLDLEVYEDLLGDFRDSLEQDESLYLAAFDPETAVLFYIEVPRLRSWHDLNVADENEIENEIIPEYLEVFENSNCSIQNSGFEILGSQKYLYVHYTYADELSLCRYYTMIQTKDGLFGVKITASDMGNDGPVKCGNVAREAAQAISYIGTEGNDVSLLTDDYTVSLRLPSDWTRLFDESSRQDNVWWGDEGGNDIMLWTYDKDDWMSYSDEQKKRLGYRTRADMILKEDDSLGEMFLQKYYGNDMPDYEYLYIREICFLNSTYSYESDNVSMYGSVPDFV